VRPACAAVVTRAVIARPNSPRSKTLRATYDDAMNAFDIASILVAAAAAFGYLNHRVLRLPATSGTLVVALVSSFILLAAQALFPPLSFRPTVAAFVAAINFDQTLMHGMLCFLLFAGALHVDLHGLMANKWTIGALATGGVLLSTALIGLLMWWTLRVIDVPLPLAICLVFGALISPTDPIAVIGLLRELHAPESLEAQIAGESLFNDGIGVVVFFALLSTTKMANASEMTRISVDSAALAVFFIREVGGGIALGLAVGYVGYRALRSIDDHALELLITLALAMFLYSLSFWIHVSGPIAVVVAGLLIGNPGRQFAMSARTIERVDAFWSMIDGILNAVLFLMLGLGVLALPAGVKNLEAGLLAIPITIVARFISVALPITAMRAGGELTRGLVPVLTWSGLRGGISVAMVLSLPQFPGKSVLLTATYSVVVFTIVVQGLTVPRLLRYYGIGEPTSKPFHKAS
jgi:CPA1 family monovalent cation:H+ antiporter